MGSNGTYPFRLGCTSYVIPDDILPNVEFMAGKIDDIELVLFESQDISNIPDKDTLISLQQIAIKENTTYSVHFPIDQKAGASNDEERANLIESITGIIIAASSLPVSGYLLHFEGLATSATGADITAWHRRIVGFCKELTDRNHVDPALICIENLGYAPELHEDIVSMFHFSNCIDIGHLWLQHNEWESYCNRILPSTRIIHLHGISKEGKDHHSLAEHNNKNQLKRLIPLLEHYNGIITMEVFSEQDTFESLAVFEDLWQKSH